MDFPLFKEGLNGWMCVDEVVISRKEVKQPQVDKRIKEQLGLSTK